MRENVLANMPNGLETGLGYGGGLIGPTDEQKVETRQGRSWDRLAVKGVPAGVFVIVTFAGTGSLVFISSSVSGPSAE